MSRTLFKKCTHLQSSTATRTCCRVIKHWNKVGAAIQKNVMWSQRHSDRKNQTRQCAAFISFRISVVSLCPCVPEFVVSDTLVCHCQTSDTHPHAKPSSIKIKCQAQELTKSRAAKVLQVFTARSGLRCTQQVFTLTSRRTTTSKRSKLLSTTSTTFICCCRAQTAQST